MVQFLSRERVKKLKTMETFETTQTAGEMKAAQLPPPQPITPPPPPPAPQDSIDADQRRFMIGALIGLLLFLVLTIGSIVYLMQPTTDTARIRDIFIIFMGFQSLLMGLVLIILIVQLAKLINLLQNEIKPILDSTNETVSTLRGTTTFISDSLAEPIIKLNEYTAAISQLMVALGLSRKPKNK